MTLQRKELTAIALTLRTRIEDTIEIMNRIKHPSLIDNPPYDQMWHELRALALSARDLCDTMATLYTGGYAFDRERWLDAAIGPDTRSRFGI